MEDNLINQKVLANQLRKRGFEVSCAIHGAEALDMLHMAESTSTTTTAGSPTSPTASIVGNSSVIRRKPVPNATASAVANEFDVVLLDIEMPIMDGYTCAQQIRAFELNHADSRRRLPIIAVTANVRSEHSTAALESGMDAITTKPYKIEDLVAQIEQCRMMTNSRSGSESSNSLGSKLVDGLG